MHEDARSDVGGPTARGGSIEGMPATATVERAFDDRLNQDAMEILSMPGEHAEVPPAVDAWIDAAADSDAGPAFWMAFQGSRIRWSPSRCAILAPAERLAAIRRAVIEVSAHDRMLRQVERTLEAAWPELDTDAPLAFEFEERSVGRRDELRDRLKRVLHLRARLARIAPAVLAPPIYPPTLASQVADRLQERLRIVARHEAASIQADVFRDTYDMCGQRASDFMLARTGHRLEWVIIVLLAAQLLLWAFEYLAMAGG